MEPAVSKPLQGEHRANTQSKAFGATVAAVHDSPNALHGARHGIVAGHGLVGHGLVGGHAIAHAPVVHAAPAYHAPVVAHAAEVYSDEVSPYTYNYAVADDYSASNFNAAESSDGAGSAEGSYSVNLPDGRTQHVSYTSDPVNGYVAAVTYDGTAQYPDTPVVHAAVHAAPVVHAAAPVYHARTAGQSSHQSVSKPYQGEARTTSQAKAFGSPIASVSSSDSVSNTAQAGLAQHLGQGAVVGHGLVGGHGLIGGQRLVGGHGVIGGHGLLGGSGLVAGHGIVRGHGLVGGHVGVGA